MLDRDEGGRGESRVRGDFFKAFTARLKSCPDSFSSLAKILGRFNFVTAPFEFAHVRLKVVLVTKLAERRLVNPGSAKARDPGHP